MTLPDYIFSTYQQLITQLDWDGQIDSIISKTLQLYGMDSEEDVDDTEALEKIADYVVWKQALADISLDFDFSEDGVGSYSRSKAVEQVRANMNAAYMAALPYLSEYQITIHADPTNSDWWEADDAADL
jgi:hypothetical protein